MVSSRRTAVIAIGAVNLFQIATASSPSSGSHLENQLSSRPWGMAKVPRGGESVEPEMSSSSPMSDYASQCEALKGKIVEKTMDKILELQKTIVDESTVVPNFGSKADEICNSALEEFASSDIPGTTSDSEDMAAIYDSKLAELESALDAPLQVLYLKQLALLREKALDVYKMAAKASTTSDYEAMLQADSQFVASAEESTRSDVAGWDYSLERSYLQSVLNSMAASRKQLLDSQLSAADKQSTAMQFLQQQQQIIQQLQMQLYGQTSPWNVGVAYRIPDTNFNLNGNYQQGRASLSLSCVPDEYAPMLGPNGFTQGVGPGNLGLSLNLSF